jgi:dTDP-4-amino-4,6-dideoxygalactose transaminase
VFHQYVIRTPHRDALQRHLREHNIGSEVYYPVPLHLQRCFAYLSDAPDAVGSHPCAERAAREVLALPIHPELSAAQIERVVGTVGRFLRRAG